MAYKYQVTIKTGDQFKAGTDSNIFLTMYGAKGISQEERLNQHISGNAFERNDTDTLTLTLDEDLGDIYMIEIRSDMMYAGAGWLCNSFKIQKADSCMVTFQMPSNNWIEDEKVRQYCATSGYDFDLGTPATQVTKIYGAEHMVAAGVTYKQTVKNSIDIEVDKSTVQVISTQTKLSVSAKLSAINAAFDFQINSSLTTQLDQKLNTLLEVTNEVEFEKSDVPRKFVEVWSQSTQTYSVKMSDVLYQFSLPSSLAFAGFEEIS